MTIASQLSSMISGSVSHSALGASAAAVTTAKTSTTDAFGPAVVLDLSGSAQNAVDSQGGTSSTSSGANSGSSASSSDSSTSASGGAAPAGGGGGGAPASSSSTTSEELATEIAEAKRKVAAQVGVVAANELVDSKGNIDTVGLARALAQQEQTQEAQKSA